MDPLEQKRTSCSPRSQSPLLDSRFHDDLSSLRPEPVNFKFMCSCKICYLETSELYKLSVQKPVPKPAHKSLCKGYTWLLEKLGEISLEQTIKINIPDVAVFKDAHPYFCIQSNRDRTIKFFKSGERLKAQEVIKNISSTSRTRKREEINSFNKIMLSSTIGDFGRDVACIRYMKTGFFNDITEPTAFDEEGALKVMSENEFMGLLWQRQSNPLWKMIAYIQSVLKCRSSIGESFLHFYSFEGVSYDEIIDAGLADNEEFESFMFSQDKPKYCELIFKRIYYFLEKFADVRLKSIQGEFLRDENNKIWLIYSSCIEVEAIAKKKIVENAQIKPLIFDKVHKDELLTHLRQVAQEPKNVRTEKISQVMKTECEKMISAYKITDLFKEVEFEKVNVAAYAKLRPSTPVKLYLEEDKTKNKGKMLKRAESEKKKMANDKVWSTPSPKKEYYSPLKQTNSWVYKPKFKISPIKNIRKPIWSPHTPHTPHTPKTHTEQYKL